MNPDPRNVLATDPYPLPARSPLFSIPPRGLATWKVESLFSFASRLAEAHGISMYGLQSMITKENLEKGLGPKHKLHSTQCGFEGFSLLGKTAKTWTKALNSLQHQEWADGTTLLSLEHLISTHNLSPQLRRYCPACQRADLGEGIAYEYLLWRFSAVTVCPEHGCLLETAPRESQHFHARRQLTQQRSQNRDNSESNPKQRQPISNFEQELARSKLIANFLESPFFKHKHLNCDNSNTATFLRAIINRHMNGNAQSLCKYLQISKGQLSGWINRKHIPSFECIVDFAQAFSCSIESILSGDESAIPMILPGYQRLKKGSFRRENHYHTNAFKTELRSVMSKSKVSGIHPSLTFVSKSLGVDISSIQLSQPDLAKQIINNHVKSKTNLSILCRNIRENMYRMTAIYLAENGVLPTRRKVWNLLQTIPLLTKGDERMCQDICYEVRKTHLSNSHQRKGPSNK